ncbi:targeting protein for Xklp2 [Halyomorpha halys]|uniref:targeting protein for Xklp2 n=1 Tax=Halyomorpha halys TaxID=286706 RepID=UPI0006D4F18A|nr:targeting protein for Xklp2-like [Halyomorpha halys]
MAQTDVFNFQAPQFIESLSEVKLDDGADTFFDATESPPKIDVQETNEEIVREEIKEENDLEKAEEENFVEGNGEEVCVESLGEEVSGSKRNVAAQVKVKTKNGMSSNENDENLDPELKSNGPVTRLQRMSMKTNGSLGMKNQSKFLSVAEQIHKFHHSTPPRFKRKSTMFKSKSCKFLPTVAHSPQLRTKIRAARPSTAPTIIVPDDKEKSVIKKKEVIKRVAIKPVPKPPTIPVPFNLTVPGNKKQEEKKEERSENIKEASSIKENKQVEGTPRTLLRKPLPPKKKHLEIQDNKITVKESWRVTGIKTIQKPNSTTKAVPFSFEKRNQERLMEKQKKLEEEQNKAASSSSSSIPRKLPRQSTASHPVTTKPLSKVKNETKPTGRPSRNNAK